MLGMFVCDEVDTQREAEVQRELVEIERENVSSISTPTRPKGRVGLDLAPWSGAPNRSMVGGPPSHSAI
jgi:hypothetical protein